MNHIQKSLAAAAAIAVVGVGIFEWHQASGLREQVRGLQGQQAEFVDQIQQLQRERDDAKSRLNARESQDAASKSNPDTGELLKLRREVAQLRSEQSAQTRDAFTAAVLAETARAARLNEQLARMPERRIPELGWLALTDWLDAVKDADLESEAGVRKALSRLRQLAKNRLYPVWQNAFRAYLDNNAGQLPGDLTQLKPYFDRPVDDSILARYQLLSGGSASNLKPGDYIMSERAPADQDYGERYEMGLGHDRQTHF